MYEISPQANKDVGLITQLRCPLEEPRTKYDMYLRFYFLQVVI